MTVPEPVRRAYQHISDLCDHTIADWRGDGRWDHSLDGQAYGLELSMRELECEYPELKELQE